MNKKEIMQQQQQASLTKKFKQMCVQIKPVHGIQVLIAFCIVIFYGYAISMLYTIDNTLKSNSGLTENEFEDQYKTTRIELYQLRDVFVFIIVALSCVITVWVWNYLIPLKTKVNLIENKGIGLIIVLFFFIVSLVSFFEISKKSFTNESVKTLNVAAMFFSVLILFLYIVVYFYNRSQTNN